VIFLEFPVVYADTLHDYPKQGQHSSRPSA